MIGQTRRQIIPWLGGGIVLLALAVVVSVALGAWGIVASTAPEASTEPVLAATDGQFRTNEGGQVTVTVTWQGPAAGPRFIVVLDTHVVDLDGYDLRQLAVLRTDDGREVPPLTWDAPQGGHHREGTLIFPETSPEGTPLIGPPAQTIELVIRGIADVPERSFRWTP